MSNNQQPEALRLAHLLALDKWPDAAAELRRQHARIAELDSEATENARIIGASAETELALRGHIAELEAQLSAIGAGGVESLRKRAEAAPQAVQAAVPEAIEQMAAVRYKVVPSHESMFHRWAVVADTGAQQLYIGREGECQNMARKFMSAFLDGAFVAMQNAAPQIDWESAAEKIAIEVADNCGTVPNLTHPHIYLGLKKLFTSHPTQQELDAFEPQVPDDFLASESKSFSQLHVGRDHKGDRVWHTNSEGTFWCGDWRSRTPAELERECLSTVKDLRALAAQAKKGGAT